MYFAEKYDYYFSCLRISILLVVVKVFIIFIMLASCLYSYAQLQITGKISDLAGNPLAGATICGLYQVSNVKC
jgi:hypothetical protein